MSQQSENRLPKSFGESASSARILPFERPQSELQKAVQLRAQQAIELDRTRDSRKAPVARWLIGLIVAVVPVLVLIGGLDGFLRIFHKINEAYATMPATTAPAEAVSEPEQVEPGVVMLRPMESIDSSNRVVAPTVSAQGKK